jgi:hypothetical protein
MNIGDDLRTNVFGNGRPHIVVLGAGASLAALPDGDRHGRKIPLLNDLPSIAGEDWREIVEEANPPEGNFEAQYSWICESGFYTDKLQRVEERILDFFASLELPDEPTIYDYLLLSLRQKDVVATFNWDPFLMQAHSRNRDLFKLPDIRFLHGSVAYTSCVDHDILGRENEACPICGNKLGKASLIFPLKEKDYTADKLIDRDWDAARKALKKAFHLTIFGYSGPVTDFAARQLLLDAWKENPITDFCHAEIVDIKDQEELAKTWKEFFPHHHDMYSSSFWDSSIAKWPRRTEEWKMLTSYYGVPSQFINVPRFSTLKELQEWFLELAEHEKDKESNKTMEDNDLGCA